VKRHKRNDLQKIVRSWVTTLALFVIHDLHHSKPGAFQKNLPKKLYLTTTRFNRIRITVSWGQYYYHYFRRFLPVFR
jgi:hypothetical protein